MAIIVDLTENDTIGSYNDLVQLIIDFSHRSDIAAKVPSFIRLAEDKIYAVLESNKQDVSTTLTTEANVNDTTLPTDLITLRSAYIIGNNNANIMKYLTPDQMNSQYDQETTGVPFVYTLTGSFMLMRPIPDDAYTINIIYEARLSYLSSTNSTNWLLANYPLVYLYAALEQLAMYIMEDPSFYETEWQRVVEGINRRDWYESSTMTVKTDVNLSRFMR